MRILFGFVFGIIFRFNRGKFIFLIIKILYFENFWINYFFVNFKNDVINSNSSYNSSNIIFCVFLVFYSVLEYF